MIIPIEHVCANFTPINAIITVLAEVTVCVKTGYNAI